MLKHLKPISCLFPDQSYLLFSALRFKRCLLLILIVTTSIGISAQRARVNEEDESNADALSRKYKDDDVMCTSSHHYFTFDKGKNSLNDKVVVIEEEAELEFLSLKKF